MTSTVRRLINSFNYRVLGPLRWPNAGNWATKTDFHKTHRRVVKLLRQSCSPDEAARRAVGGEFEGVGLLMREVLILHGLTPLSYLIDVGCGSGRLAKPLPSI
jgi:2-polyprenyl-3-methyl-5-hydroxy-6-metoxy-1,4-benzoquinol methylase